MAGVTLITLGGGDGGGAVKAAGVALALGAAVTYALLIVLLKRWASAVAPVTSTVWTLGIAALVLSPAALLGDYSVTPKDAGHLLALGLALTAAVDVVFMRALLRVPATTVGIVAYLEPVSAGVLAALLLGEPLTAPVVLGGLAVVGAGISVWPALPTPSLPTPWPRTWLSGGPTPAAGGLASPPATERSAHGKAPDDH